MHSALVAYEDGGAALEGFAAYSSEEKRPLVLLCHGWRGRDEFICEKARALAEAGYASFALDMYGKGILGRSKEENASLKRPFLEDRALLQRRVLKALDVASRLPYVDSKRIAAVGFGFGGLCALDLARSGADIRGVVSFYGHFDPPPSQLIRPIRAKILILHGYNDPQVRLSELQLFEREMDDSKIDWQVHLYGNTLHAFASPNVNVPESGLQYNPESAARAWSATINFLSEIF
ncbi:MAG: dienelactone hydrolase family protein [Chlamydiales bacterium]|nr:dienelactone hydrolase family protein [Chlamydiales bacterium]